MGRGARWLTIALVWAMAMGVHPGSASAQEADCKQVGIKFVCFLRIVGSPGGPPVGAPLGPHVPFVWLRQRANGVPGATFVCYREYPGFDDNGVAVTVQEWGTGWVIVVIDPSTGGTFDDIDTWITFTFDCEYEGEDPPGQPPTPPTPDQVRDAFEDAVVVSTELSPPPQWGGITGLETWFWCTSPGAVSLDPPLELNGYTVNATMTPLLYTWSVSGPASGGYSGPDCGAPPGDDGDGSAWAWTPQQMGPYAVTLTVDWTLTWSLTYDFGAGPVTLPQAVYPDPVPVPSGPVEYPVDEYRGVLTG